MDQVLIPMSPIFMALENSNRSPVQNAESISAIFQGIIHMEKVAEVVIKGQEEFDLNKQLAIDNKQQFSFAYCLSPIVLC